MKKTLFLLSPVALASLIQLCGALPALARAQFEVLAWLGNIEGSPGRIFEGSDGVIYGTTSFGGQLDGGIIFKINRDGSGRTVLHDLSYFEGTGPFSGVVEGNDGVLYGTAQQGGQFGWGTVFRINRDGSGHTVLHHFNLTNGGEPTWLIEGSDGALYGTTYAGGQDGRGTLFKINRDGSGHTVLRSFSLGEGIWKPIEGPDGALYGPALGYRALVKINRDGSGYTVLHTFSDGVPIGLIEGSDGALYGMTSGGGQFGWGTVFKINPDGSGFAVLHSFNDAGASPGSLVQGSDGALYGTTFFTGQAAGSGTIFKINRDGSGYTVLNNTPAGNLFEGSDGALYGIGTGTHYSSFGTLFKINRDGSGRTVLHEFDNWDGANPYAGLIEGSDGVLYWPSYSGGRFGFGTISKINRDGSGHSILHSFDRSDGAGPFGRLVESSDGAFYGTTEYGGQQDYGTVFRINRDGSGHTVLHSFNNTDGKSPKGLVEASDGALYGTTSAGGQAGHGTVFKINRDGSGHTVLHNFNTSDGAEPYGQLVEDSDGVLYGTTYSGGQFGSGTVFRINRDGSGHTVLHSFNNDDGSHPYAGVIKGSDGALYGTAYDGGPMGYGVVFKIDRDGTGYSLLHSFDSSGGDGKFVFAGLVESRGGALYGACFGLVQYGTVFRVNRDGTGFTVLQQFYYANGDNPAGALIQARDGAFYGTTLGGGLSAAGNLGVAPGSGVIYRVPADGDVDGIPDSVDTNPATFSNDFTDVSLGGTTSGSIVNRNGLSVWLEDSPNPAGFQLNAYSNDPSVPVNAAAEFAFMCAGIPYTLYLEQFDRCVVTCGSLTVESLIGSIRIAVANSVLVTVSETTSVKIAEQADGSVKISNISSAESKDDQIVVTVNQQSTELARGDSAVITNLRLTIACPADIVKQTDPGQCSAVVTYAVNANRSDVDVVCTPPSGSAFPKGTTKVTCTATDQAGSTATCSFNVTVLDREPPRIVCPADITLPCSVGLLVPATFAATATDNCDPAPTNTYSQPSGSGFPVGTTTVVCTAADSSGNKATCSFAVRRPPLEFSGFLAPIGGADATGGSNGAPLRAFKLNSTIPVKFTAACGGTPVTTGVHTLKATLWSNATTSDATIDATPTDAATTGNQFRLVDGQWQFNLDTKATGMTIGQWELVATLSDGSQHKVWIQLK